MMNVADASCDTIVKLLAIVRRASMETEPNEALLRLREDCVEATDATVGRFYLLNLESACYVLHDPARPPGDPPCQISLLQPPDFSSLRWVIDNRRTKRSGRVNFQPRCRGDLPLAKSRLIVPILRDHTCIGLIDLDSTEEDHFTCEHEKVVELAAEVAVLLLEEREYAQPAEGTSASHPLSRGPDQVPRRTGDPHRRGVEDADHRLA